MTIVFVLLYLTITKQTKLLSIFTPIMTTIRSLIFFIGFTMFYYSQTQMPVANALTLFYVSPFFITILSMFLLGEKIDLVRWVIIILGFSGVYFIANPNFEEFNYINLLPVLCALFYGIFMVFTKKYSTTESSFAQLFYLSLGSLIISGVLGLIVGDGKYYTNSNVSMNYLSRSWNFIDAGDIGLMLLSALCGFIGTVFLINAYRIGNPSRITPFEYSGLIPTMMLGYLIWDDIPTKNTWLGILIIILLKIPSCPYSCPSTVPKPIELSFVPFFLPSSLVTSVLTRMSKTQHEQSSWSPVPPGNFPKQLDFPN